MRVTSMAKKFNNQPFGGFNGDMNMIKGNGYHFNGEKYITYFKGVVIGAFRTREQAWAEIGKKAWGLK